TSFSRDWSSDVCSSDLVRLGAAAAHGTSDGKGRGRVYSLRPVCGTLPDGCMGHDEIGDPAALRRPAGANRGGGRAMTAMVQDRRSEERRVGKEGEARRS